jgi:hypothetical protein
MELVRSSVSIVSGLPCEKVRSAPAIVVSGPAQRLLTLWPARSRSRLATLSIESSDSLVASAAVSIATGWSEPVPGRELHPLKSSAFHGALFRQLRFPRWRNLQKLNAFAEAQGLITTNGAPLIVSCTYEHCLACGTCVPRVDSGDSRLWEVGETAIFSAAAPLRYNAAQRSGQRAISVARPLG